MNAEGYSETTKLGIHGRDMLTTGAASLFTGVLDATLSF